MKVKHFGRAEMIDLGLLKIYLRFALCARWEPASRLQPRTIGGTGDLRWQCGVNCHLF